MLTLIRRGWYSMTVLSTLNRISVNHNEKKTDNYLIRTDTILLQYSIYDIITDEKKLTEDYIDFGWSDNCFKYSEDLHSKTDSLNFVIKKIAQKQINSDFPPTLSNINLIKCFDLIDFLENSPINTN